jgi:hypothetical protein
MSRVEGRVTVLEGKSRGCWGGGVLGGQGSGKGRAGTRQ